ncbi:MAG: diaminopimelate epimerase [Elusimicrobia bacterium CG08_land_8_20_14_0_20_51_18]|nr:MAG: diaminopimelate epimerase [Elusimicrobia bacterium CG08_land_8_20_14_0_20_51_18]
MRIKFWKMSGAGNDFVLLYGLKASPAKKASLAAALCRRGKAVGADGLLLVNKLGRGSVRMEYFNSDGSGAFCGNGARCSALWAWENGLASGKKLSLLTAKGILPAEIKGADRVRIKMPDVKEVKLDLKGNFPSWARKVHFLDTGVPHAVVPVKGLDSFDVFSRGRELRNHKFFGKAGTNVNFITLKKGVIRVRTYERGVEDETLACGTGITASAIAAGLLGKLKKPVKAVSRSGEKFSVWFEKKGPGAGNVFIEGPAETVFKGEIDIRDKE